MLTYNQKGFPIEWEALGQTYKWDPYGSCEVPEKLFEHIKLERLPIALTPVPPKVKADESVAKEQAAAQADTVRQLKGQLELAQAKAKEAASAVEAAEKRAAHAAGASSELTSRVKLLEEQLRQAQSDAGEFEKMAAEAQAESAELRKQLASLEAQAKQGRQSRK